MLAKFDQIRVRTHERQIINGTLHAPEILPDLTLSPSAHLIWNEHILLIILRSSVQFSFGAKSSSQDMLSAASPSVCLLIPLSVCPSASLSICLSPSLSSGSGSSIRPFISSSDHQSDRLSIRPTVSGLHQGLLPAITGDCSCLLYVYLSTIRHKCSYSYCEFHSVCDCTDNLG